MKSWMRRREDETERQRGDRLNHTCVHCGLDCGTLPATDAHEDNCPKKPGNSDEASD